MVCLPPSSAMNPQGSSTDHWPINTSEAIQLCLKNHSQDLICLLSIDQHSTSKGGWLKDLDLRTNWIQPELPTLYSDLEVYWAIESKAVSFTQPATQSLSQFKVCPPHYEYNTKSGEIIYIDNRPPIPRSASQKEDIKIVLEF